MATNVSLTPELEEYVNTKVRSGDYCSASEVVRDGLRLLKERDMLQAEKLKALRQAVRKGIESGESTPLDMDQLLRKAKRLHQKR